MKTLSDYIEADTGIEVGQLTIHPLDEFQVWIEDETGEGMAIEKKILEQYLLRCVMEHHKR